MVTDFAMEACRHPGLAVAVLMLLPTIVVTSHQVVVVAMSVEALDDKNLRYTKLPPVQDNRLHDHCRHRLGKILISLTKVYHHTDAYHRNRPLDPAVDPDRTYVYKGKGPKYGAESGRAGPRQSTATLVNNTVRVTSSSSASACKSMLGNYPVTRAPVLSAKAKDSVGRRADVLLADPNSFMAAVKTAPGNCQPSQPGGAAKSSALPASSKPGLGASK